MRKTILAFGEVLWDLLPSGPKLGGAPFNFAYRVHSLGDLGLIVSRLGRDPLGDEAGQRIDALGMDMRFVQRDDSRPTGTVNVTLDANHNPDFAIVPHTAYDHIVATEEMVDLATQADCLYFGTLIQRSATSRRALQLLLDISVASLKILDINLRKNCYTRETIEQSLARADILRLNEDEARFLVDYFGYPERSIVRFAERIMAERRLSHCLVTLGERGAFAASAKGEKVYVPGCKVELADTCGAGDAFTAGFIHRHLRGGSLRECLEIGNALGAMVAMQPGATEPIAPEEIQRFIEAGHERVFEQSLEEYASA